LCKAGAVKIGVSQGTGRVILDSSFHVIGVALIRGLLYSSRENDILSAKVHNLLRRKTADEHKVGC
jgi:hypothetical protein